MDRRRLRYQDGFHGAPPILSFFDPVQFRSPPTISEVISIIDYAIVELLHELELIDVIIRCIDIGQ